MPEDIILDDKQYAEMSQIHSSLDELASDELESIFREGEQQGTQIGSTLRHAMFGNKINVCVMMRQTKVSLWTKKKTVSLYVNMPTCTLVFQCGRDKSYYYYGIKLVLVVCVFTPCRKW